MQYHLKALEDTSLPMVLSLASEIYNGVDEDKYPDFRVGYDINAESNREKFFSMFMLSPAYIGFTQRRSYGVFDENETLIAAVGVRRYDHFPCWSLSWLLSPKIGARFIPLFRFIVDELCKIHEAAGINELLVTYPASREEAYSRIMLFMRERYFTFVETTVKEKTASPYEFIHELLGKTLHPHDMNLRRYIRRREDMTPASEGGQAKRKAKTDNDSSD
jgi:hypothetical protein